MSLIFDSHAHYDDEAYDSDRRELLEGLKDNGVGLVMNISARVDEIPGVLKLADEYDFIYASSGVHPSEVYELNSNDLRTIEEALSHDKVKAVGEIGLDYHYDDTDKKKQIDWFVNQIEIAKKNGYPIIVHSREAAADTLDIIKSCNGDSVGGVIHCFSYEPEMAKMYMNLGFHIGVGGVLTFKNSRKLKEIVQMMPMDLMLLETDCPYLAPTPFRGERNDSTMLKYVVDEITNLKGIGQERIKEITWDNACRLFNIDA